MQVRALMKPADTARLELITLHSAMGAMALWLGVVIREWPQLTTYGALCSEAQTLFGHCPLCLPAAALTVIAFGGAAMLLARSAEPG